MLKHGVIALAMLFLPPVSASSQVSVGHSDLTYEAGGWDYTHPAFACGGSVRYTTGVPGSRVSLQFEGTGIDLYLPRSPEGASIEVNLDGDKAKLDTQKGNYDCNTPIYGVSNLAFGNHTIKVQTLDTKTLYVSKFVYTVPDTPSDVDDGTTRPSTTPPPPTEGTFHRSNNLRLIFGVAGGLCGLLLIASIWAFIRHRRRLAQQRASQGHVAYGPVGRAAADGYSTHSRQSMEELMRPTYK